ncbi:MAG: ABC transporter permease [Candidatus Marinimicrobia bacterium]|nr:ABC transporter permease [Candidatus Neomarinimicrobiota bacterium]
MNWEKFISNRFYDSSKNQGWYSGLFSMIGMGVGCFAMIISLSVMNGFETLVHGKLKGFEGDLRIVGHMSETPVLGLNGIEAAMPYMERRGVIESNDVQKVVSLKAVNEKTMESFYNLPLRGATPKSGQVAIGQDLAYRLGKDIGDEIIVYSPIDQAIGFGLPPRKKLVISAIFSTKVLDYDDRFVFLSMSDGKSLFRRKSGYDGVDLRIKPNSDINQIKYDLIRNMGPEMEIQSWEDLNRSLVDAMKMERLGTIVILCLIFLVAAFNLAAALTLISIQRMKEVGILRAMGAPTHSVLKMIIQLGLSRAGKGAISGFVSGILLVLVQTKFSLIPIPSDIYFVDALPMVLMPRDLFIIVILSFIFIIAASYTSGRKLAHSNIKEALQWAK